MSLWFGVMCSRCASDFRFGGMLLSVLCVVLVLLGLGYWIWCGC